MFNKSLTEKMKMTKLMKLDPRDKYLMINILFLDGNTICGVIYKKIFNFFD